MESRLQPAESLESRLQPAESLESRLQPAFLLALLLLTLVVSVNITPTRADDSTLPDEPLITADQRDHWAYRPVAAVDPPPVQDAAWPHNEIDRFILARLEAESVLPQPPADRATLLRRVTFYLPGLPPTPDEQAAFLSDDAPDAYERLIDRLLASPTYGERWAQHWLDLARFAETDGFEFDHIRPQAWRYRDWVIDALNADLPYDRFLALQLAADELAPGDAEALQATGFLLAGPDMPDINLQEERRHTLLNELTATVGAVTLGLQFGCAACHDHKFDPISQADFYRLRACFEPLDVTAAHPAGRVAQEIAPPPAARFYIRGDFRRPGAELAMAYPRIANVASVSAAPTAVTGGTLGRRAALAAWLTSTDNPLVARVIVNRLWQYHFGQGLVRTASDFGALGDTPSHPELLDWLAADLVRGGWGLKRMHRLMLTSATYQQRSVGTGEFDPENRLLARMNRQRQEGEALRDCLLSAAGTLNHQRGGRGVMPPLPAEMLGTLLKDQWVESPDPADHLRRGIYVFVRRNLRYPLFDVLDSPDRSATCPRRNVTTTATQALWLLNSEQTLTRAREFAGLLLRAAPASAESRIDLAFRRALCRPPTADELSASLEFLSTQSDHLRAAGRMPADLAQPIPAPTAADHATDPHSTAALVDFCLALFNLNEFVYID